MIKGITAGRGITVGGGQPVSTYINNYGGQPGVGNMRYNPNSNNIEVYDGNSWQQLMTSYATVELDADTQTLLAWAREEKNRQLQRESRIRSNPALRKAYEAIQRAEENFDILDRIAGETSLGEVQASS